MAEDLDKQLDDLSRNLSQMIEEVNRLSSSSSGPSTSSLTDRPDTPSAADVDAAAQMPEDPVGQLSAILGAHLRALNSIDGNAGRLEGKVAELEKRMGGDKRGAYGLARR